MEYGDLHRWFLQGMMSHTVLAEKEALALFSKICEDLNSGHGSSMNDMVNAIKLINENIAPMNMKVKLAACELTGDPFYVLVNTVQSKIPSKMPRYAKAASQVEKEFMKAVLHAIVRTSNGCLSSVDCLNLSNTLSNVHISRSDADKLLQKLIDKKWFVEKSSIVSLSVRCITEMEPYIRQVAGEAVMDCKLCRNLILQGKSCVHCLAKFHQHCLGKYFKRQTRAKCPECRGDWEEAAEDNNLGSDDEN